MHFESRPMSWPLKHFKKMKTFLPLHSQHRQPSHRSLWFSFAIRSIIAMAAITRFWASTGASWASRGIKAMVRSSGVRRLKTVVRWRVDGSGLLVLPLLYSTSSKLLSFLCYNWIVELCQKRNFRRFSERHPTCDWYKQFDFMAFFFVLLRNKKCKNNFVHCSLSNFVGVKLYLKCLHSLPLIRIHCSQ